MVPLLFRGPTESRFYFKGDHWQVCTDQEGVIVSLEQKNYSRWQLFLSYCLIPGCITLGGFVLYVSTGKPEALWAGVVAALAAGLPMYYFQKTEMARLAREPAKLFVLRSDKTVVIRDEIYQLDSFSELTLYYTLYQASGHQGDSGHSELDIVLGDGECQQRIHLLSHESDYATTHARRLHRATGIKHERNLVL